MKVKRSKKDIEIDLLRQEVAILRKQLADVSSRLTHHVCYRSAPVYITPPQPYRHTPWIVNVSDGATS